jgi:hypothetical protein
MRCCSASSKRMTRRSRVSWSVYDGQLEFRPRPSRSLASWVLLGHLLAGFAALTAGLPGWLLLPVLLSLRLAIRRALRPLGPGVRALCWSRARGWERLGAGTSRVPVELRDSSAVTTGAMFLHWQDERGPWRVVLLRDSMHPDDWRRMHVIVGLHEGRARMPAAAAIATRAGRTLRTAPGLSEWRMDSPGFRGACPNGREKQRPVAGREGPAG